jgi:CelD/BcsL family acetyltransferase involved in cellulose biosynthesis
VDAGLRQEWERLAAAADNVFSTPEWAEEWLRHVGPRRTLLEPVTAGGVVRAVLPLVVSRVGPLRVARFVGHGPGDELGPVCAPEDRPLAAEALMRSLRDHRVDVLLAEQLRGDAGWEEHLGGRILRESGSPVIRFDGRSWDELVQGWSSNFRQRVRREPRRVERDLDVSYRLADAGTLDADLDALFSLHRARWETTTEFLRFEPFHRAFARRALERGWLRLWVLEIAGGPAAVWYGLRFQGAESYYQAGRDPQWQQYSLGLVLLVHTIRSAVEDGMREYRFLRGDEDYKYKFTSDDPGLETLAVPMSARGRVALAAGVELDRVRRAVRARAGRA